MNARSKEKFVSDVNVQERNVMARRPFSVQEEDDRRFVRIEISSPVSMSTIKDAFGNFLAEVSSPTIEGTILNISPSGVLVEIDQPLSERDIVSMKFTMQDCKPVTNVLGLVKRCDCNEEMTLVGIEFINRNMLEDYLSEAEITMLSSKLASFSDSVVQVLETYLYRDEHQATAE